MQTYFRDRRDSISHHAREVIDKPDARRAGINERSNLFSHRVTESTEDVSFLISLLNLIT
jgi:hypothetical protein